MLKCHLLGNFFSRDSDLTTSVVHTFVRHQNPLIINKLSLISCSSVAHQSLAHQSFISCSSVAHQLLISCSSVTHQSLISRSSVAWIATFKRFSLVCIPNISTYSCSHFCCRLLHVILLICVL